MPVLQVEGVGNDDMMIYGERALESCFCVVRFVQWTDERDWPD